MRKNTVNYLIDGCAFVIMLVITATGLLMKYTLPPGSGGKVVWGLGRHAWGGVHFWAAAALLSLLVLHVALHWAWVCASTRRLKPGGAGRPARSDRDRAYGLALLAIVAVLLAAFVFITRAAITAAPPGAERGEHASALREGAGGGWASPVETGRRGAGIGERRRLRGGS